MNDWMLIDEEPYTRRDGSATVLWVWQRPCGQCGALFRVKAPAAILVSGSFLSKRCAGCRDPKDVARGKARAAVYLQKLANSQKTAACNDGNAECNTQFSTCNSATPVQRCATVHGAKRRSATPGPGPFSKGPAVLQRCGARCDQFAEVLAKNCVLSEHAKSCTKGNVQ